MPNAYILKADGTRQELDHRPTLKEAQKIVGGWIEYVKAREEDGEIVTLVVDEEGKVKNKPTNKEVTKLYGHSIYGGYIVGDVIVLEGWQTVGN